MLKSAINSIINVHISGRVSITSTKQHIDMTPIHLIDTRNRRLTSDHHQLTTTSGWQTGTQGFNLHVDHSRRRFSFRPSPPQTESKDRIAHAMLESDGTNRGSVKREQDEGGTSSANTRSGMTANTPRLTLCRVVSCKGWTFETKGNRLPFHCGIQSLQDYANTSAKVKSLLFYWILIAVRKCSHS